MQTIGNTLTQIGREITVSNSEARSTSTADSSRIDSLKREFVRIASEVCPGFDFSKVDRKTVLDIFNWCCLIPGELDVNKGLCLWGNIGTGKSTMLWIVKEFTRFLNIKRKNGHPSFRISHAADDVASAYEKSGLEGIRPFVKSDAQAFDELGAESIPVGHYSTNCNVMQRILQSRYDKRFTSLTHVTTNMSREKIIEVYGDRVWDRCKELFNFVEFKGKTLRKL